MPRHGSLLTVIRELVQEEVGSAIHSLLGSVSGTKPKPKNGRRRRRRRGRGTWRPGGEKSARSSGIQTWSSFVQSCANS